MSQLSNVTVARPPRSKFNCVKLQDEHVAMSSSQKPLKERNRSRFFGQGDRLCSVLIDGDHHRLMSGNALLIARLVTCSPPMLLRTNHAGTVTGTQGREGDKHLSYTSYGFRAPFGQGALPGLNGEYLDPMTGCYPLGRGRRFFSPALMRFLSSDVLSPFHAGGLNGYSYCGGDPVNKHDPSGHYGVILKNFPGISEFLTGDPNRRVTGALFNPDTKKLTDFRVKMVNGEAQIRLTDFDYSDRTMYVSADRTVFIDERFSYQGSSDIDLMPLVKTHQRDMLEKGFELKTVNPRKAVMTEHGLVVQSHDIYLSERGAVETSQAPIHPQLPASGSSREPQMSFLVRLRDKLRRKK